MIKIMYFIINFHSFFVLCQCTYIQCICLFYASSSSCYKSLLEILAVFVHGARRNAIIILYWPRNAVISNAFSEDIDDVIERSVTFACPLDPEPTWLVKRDDTDKIASMCNASETEGVFPEVLKHSVKTIVTSCFPVFQSRQSPHFNGFSK